MKTAQKEWSAYNRVPCKFTYTFYTCDMIEWIKCKIVNMCFYFVFPLFVVADMNLIRKLNNYRNNKDSDAFYFKFYLHEKKTTETIFFFHFGKKRHWKGCFSCIKTENAFVVPCVCVCFFHGTTQAQLIADSTMR